VKILWIVLGVIGAACILLVLNHDAGTVLGLPNSQFASLVWLGVWGAVVSAAVLPRGGQWRQFARNLLIWLAIILALTTGYVFRYELQDLASRVTAGIVPGSPISSASFEGRDTVTLMRSGSSQFTARGMVNDAGVLFLVDTGANVVVLTQDDAEQAGINLSALSYSVPVTTANGRTTAARINLDRVTVGDIARNDVDALVARPGSLETSLLGMSFLSRLHGFAFLGDRLILTD
jgi:aspartyl protease family protein